jgi:hypothetical protein
VPISKVHTKKKFKNLAMLLFVGGFAVFFFFLTIVKLSPHK